MSWDEEDDKTRYAVVINHEEQYSIYPADRRPPAGWKLAGKIGSKQTCLDYIEEVWTDMRPADLRRKVEAIARTLR
jgi:MbtH protein